LSQEAFTKQIGSPVSKQNSEELQGFDTARPLKQEIELK
jgi:hypothetical protein